MLTWTGSLVATALGDVSPDEVWRVLRRHRIHLRGSPLLVPQHRSAFATKAADIVGLTCRTARECRV